MAKMASLHAMREEPDVEFCNLCGEEVLICDTLDECPGRWHRRAEQLS